jgi:photosystem II stability/assembly factor-like uncharacterized protein
MFRLGLAVMRELAMAAGTIPDCKFSEQKQGTPEMDRTSFRKVPPPAKMRAMRTLLLLMLVTVPAEAQWWKVQTSGLDTNLRGVSVAYAPDAKSFPVPVVWASGSNGVILKSLDEGTTWKRLYVAGGDALDFRGIVAFNASTAYVISSGQGEKSRIYKTADGGETWKLQYTGNRKEFFLDSIACLSETHCFALSDPIDGKFLLLTTTDSEHWNPLPSDNMPAALPAEGAFAASNSCLLLTGDEIFFGTGGSAARVFHSADSGRTWTVSETLIAHGNATSGIFSITGANAKNIVIVGGDYQDPKRASAVAAYSDDEGKTWQLSPRQPGGYRSSVAHAKDSLGVAVGPNGEDVSDDFGEHWKHVGTLNLNAVSNLLGHIAWGVGPNGTIGHFYNLRRRDSPHHGLHQGP